MACHEGHTPLMCAIDGNRCHINAVRMLIANGADINKERPYNRHNIDRDDVPTALAMAMYWGHSNVINILLDHDELDPNIMSNEAVRYFISNVLSHQDIEAFSKRGYNIDIDNVSML